jgi:hypothetical protein
VASGFIVLADGRCFAPTSRLYDDTLRLVAAHLPDSTPARIFKDWLLSLLPGPSDTDIGHGWVRSVDNQTVVRKIDVRELTAENQKLFHGAARLAGDRLRSDQPSEMPSWTKDCALELADMVARADRGESPLSRSHWREVVPTEGRKVGPGW